MAKNSQSSVASASTITPPPVDSWPDGVVACFVCNESGAWFWNEATAKKHFTNFTKHPKPDQK
jgi:hypothetical protein